MRTINIKISIRGLGDMTAELYPDVAPKTVDNFVSLINRNFFDGLIFHRVIPGFMIQGGGFTAQFEPKHTAAIPGEFASNGFAQNNLRHTRGVLSMARTSDPDSASSQFFIMHADSPHLDGQYAAFGKVTSGIEVVDKIASTPTGNYGFYQDVPVEPIVIDTMSIIQEA